MTYPAPASPDTLERIATALESIAASLATVATNTATAPPPAPVQPSGPGLYRTVNPASGRG